MKKPSEVIGVIFLAGVAIFGILYLVSSTGIASKLQPDMFLGQLIGGFQDALTGIQVSISRMFSNFTK